METRGRYDSTILLLAVALTCFGIVMVYSSSSIMAVKQHADGFHFLKKQGIFAVGGLLLMGVAMHVDYHRLRPLAVPLLLGCLALLVLVLVPGVGSSAGGASRWLRVAGFTFQPSEAAKLALILYMAYSLAKKQDKIKSFKLGFVPYMLVLVVLLALLLLQPDMGSALIMAGVAVVMLLAAGIRVSHITSVILLALPFLYYGIMNVDYRRRRILSFLNPWEDPNHTGFQIIQSWIAFGTGGLFGNGLGEGKQKLFYLPAAHTDFVFSVVGEELGFAGVLIIAAMFLILVLRGLRTALGAPDDFGRYLALGLTVLVGMQAFVNIAVVLGMLPTKGLALPFISYGGTSLLCTLLAVGILLNISSQAGREGR